MTDFANRPVTPSEKARSLVLEISNCPLVAANVGATGLDHPCGEVVRSQQRFPGYTPTGHQVPEPWTGDLEGARILFVASNPSIDFAELHPHRDWPDERKLDFFTNRFGGGTQEWTRNGETLRASAVDPNVYEQSGRSAYWRAVQKIAVEMLGDGAVLGSDYALTEVVHCKSASETDGGVWSAVDVCTALYMSRILKLTDARLIVVLGRIAQWGVHSVLRFKDKEVRGDASLWEGTFNRRRRCFLFLPHPSARGHMSPFDGMTSDQLRRARSYA